MPEQLLLLILVGAVAGVMSGMFGIGGGAIIVPALIIFLGFTQKEANGTSLAALLLPVGVLAVLAYYRQGKLRIKPAAMVALGLTGGAWFGATTAIDMDPVLLSQLYGAFLLYMAWRYMSPRKWLKEVRGIQIEQVQEDTTTDTDSPRVLLITLAIGLVAGLASGMFGIGGGAVIVPALMAILAFDQKLATGTSLGALLLPVGLPGAYAYYQAGEINLATAVPLAIMLLIGAVFGARLTLGMQTKHVKRLYGLFLFVIGIRFLFNL